MHPFPEGTEGPRIGGRACAVGPQHHGGQGRHPLSLRPQLTHPLLPGLASAPGPPSLAGHAWRTLGQAPTGAFEGSLAGLPARGRNDKTNQNTHSPQETDSIQFHKY